MAPTIQLPPSVLRTHRLAAIEYIRAGVPEFREVESHGGIFTEESLKRFAMRTPACRVAMLGMPRIEIIASGQMMGPAVMAAYVIAEDEPPHESWDVAMSLVEKVMGLIDGEVFGTAAGAAQVGEWTNLFSLSGEVKGITLMAVTWRQDILFGVDKDFETEPYWLEQTGLDVPPGTILTQINTPFGPYPIPPDDPDPPEDPPEDP